MLMEVGGTDNIKPLTSILVAPVFLLTLPIFDSTKLIVAAGNKRLRRKKERAALSYEAVYPMMFLLIKSFS